MKQIKKEVDKLPNAIEEYEEGQLTAIGVIILKYSLTHLKGNLRNKVIKLAVLLCDIDEEFINPSD